jgi:hypothetical protein
MFKSGFTIRGVNLMFQMKDDQEVSTLPLVVLSKKGNPTSVEAGTVVFASSDPAILEVTDNGDGTAKVKAVGPVGTAQVQVSADADLGEGVKTVTGVADVEVVAGEAAVINISFGAPTTQA